MSYKPPMWLYQKTRALNILHALHLASAHSQMTDEEMDSLKKYATGKTLGLEIGTYMGVSGSIIAEVMTDKALLYCVDPYTYKVNKEHPCLSIAVRQMKRKHVLDKIKFLKGYSSDKKIIDQIPSGLDFIFIDGDHSYEGLRNDWQIATSKITKGGIICLHDTTIPAAQPHRNFGSVKYFEETIKTDAAYEHLGTVYSMNIVVKK